MKPVTSNGNRISKLIISTKVPASREIIAFSTGDFLRLESLPLGGVMAVF
jgi:hypothetical protein